MSVNGEIEEVKGMKSLGAMFNEEESCEDEMECRIGVTCRIVGALSKVVRMRDMAK